MRSTSITKYITCSSNKMLLSFPVTVHGSFFFYRLFSTISISSKVCSSPIHLEEWKCFSYLDTKLSSTLSTDISKPAIIILWTTISTSLNQLVSLLHYTDVSHGFEVALLEKWVQFFLKNFNTIKRFQYLKFLILYWSTFS